MKNRVTPEKIEKLEKYQIFVFGSNLLGFHGAGAAKLAYDEMWAKWGKGYGVHFSDRGDMTGSFAIPTKGLDIETLPLSWINYYIYHFIKYTKNFPQLTFLVTEVGCGLAGYKPEEIAPFLFSVEKQKNVHLPQRFWDVINEEL